MIDGCQGPRDRAKNGAGSRFFLSRPLVPSVPSRWRRDEEEDDCPAKLAAFYRAVAPSLAPLSRGPSAQRTSSRWCPCSWRCRRRRGRQDAARERAQIAGGGTVRAARALLAGARAQTRAAPQRHALGSLTRRGAALRAGWCRRCAWRDTPVCVHTPHAHARAPARTLGGTHTAPRAHYVFWRILSARGKSVPKRLCTVWVAFSEMMPNCGADAGTEAGEPGQAASVAVAARAVHHGAAPRGSGGGGGGSGRRRRQQQQQQQRRQQQRRWWWR